MKTPFKTIIEPFRIKMVEPIKMTTAQERQAILKAAHHNLFLIKADDILIDLLTDSGTGAMSAAQWGQMMTGDESYAGCNSFYQLEAVIKRLTGFQFIFPTHQGRAAERILFSAVGGPGKIIPNNTHFDTTRANVEYSGAEALDLVIAEGKDTQCDYPFKGNVDLDKLKALFESTPKENIPLAMVTVTNNSGGGQPVSMANLEAVSALCKQYQIPLFLDACRFAENAYFIKLREAGYADWTVEAIAQKMFSLTDGCTMSAKKDGLVNIGGFLALNNAQLAEQVKNLGILTEGYPTYGGMAGRDLAALAQGLEEVLDEDYLSYRIASTQYVGDALDAMGIPVVKPIGGHAVYVDAEAFLPHIPKHQFPGQALACALYQEGGIRSVEIGSFMFGKTLDNGDIQTSPLELVRLAMPRRTYTQSHMDYVLEVFEHLKKQAHSLRGFRITHEPPYLRHFSAHLEQI